MLTRSVVVEKNCLNPFMWINCLELTVVGAVDEMYHLFDCIFGNSIGLTVVQG